MTQRAAMLSTAVLLCLHGASPADALPVPLTTERIISSGLTLPLYVTAPPGDGERIFIVEQRVSGNGRIRIYKKSTQTLLPIAFLTINGVSTGAEQGLLGLAFHPQYEQNGYFYVNYTQGAGGGSTFVRRYQVSAGNPDIADPASTAILSYAQPATNHNGGWLGFGPDGYLYISSGDGGGANDTGAGHTSGTGNAQDITANLLGKLLRLDVNGDDFSTDGARNYSIPAENPMVAGQFEVGDDEIWDFGLRNPWRCSFDRLTGDLYIADVGQNAVEEVNFEPAGYAGARNYGWRCFEGTTCTGLGGCDCNTSNTPENPRIMPIHTYTHAGGNCSITGGYVYRGAEIPSLRGTYFFADYCSNKIWSFRYEGGMVLEFTDRTAELDPDAGGPISITSITSFGEDADGELYIVDQGGEIFRIKANCALSPDCNTNGTGDACEPTADCDTNGTSDLCQAGYEDCNFDGVADFCQPAGDCNSNGIPDVCELSAGDDCNTNDTTDACEGLPDCNSDAAPDMCQYSEDCNSNGTPDFCDPSGTEDCNTNLIPDPCEPGGGADCNSNGTFDLCEGFNDCDQNGVLDDCQLPPDCDTNGTPDLCDADCNADSIVDACQIGAMTDCDTDGTIDDCQAGADCNTNGEPDTCDAVGDDCNTDDTPDVCEDECNTNGTVDACDLLGASMDCDTNGTPDECEEDCNTNGAHDLCDVGVTSADCNSDGVPDECEPLPGDLDLGGTIDGDDVQPFVNCYIAGIDCGCTDMDGDGFLDIDDLNEFVMQLLAPGLLRADCPQPAGCTLGLHVAGTEPGFLTTAQIVLYNPATINGMTFSQQKLKMRPFIITPNPRGGELKISCGKEVHVELYKAGGTRLDLPATLDGEPITLLMHGKSMGRSSLSFSYKSKCGKKCTASLGVRVTCFPGLSAEPLSGIEKGDFVRVINAGQPLRTFLDVDRHREREGATYRAYVVNHKTLAEWTDANNANANVLNDVTGGHETVVTPQPGMETLVTAWGAANAGLYDIVLDFCNAAGENTPNGRLDPGDIVGLLTDSSTVAEARVITDPGATGAGTAVRRVYATTGVAGYDLPAGFDGLTTAITGIPFKGRTVYPNGVGANTPLVVFAHGNHAQYATPTATAPTIPAGRGGTTTGVKVQLDAVAENWTLTLKANGRWDIAGSVSGAQGESAAKAGLNWLVKSTNLFIELTITDNAGTPFVVGDRIKFTVKRPAADPSAPNFDGYVYIQDLLATHGFASISVDLDRFAPRELGTGIKLRGWAILKHIEAALTRADVAFDANSNIAADNIILVGHSRGGEAVLHAYRMLVNAGERPAGGTLPTALAAASIRGIVSLSPTNFHNDSGGLVTVPYLLMYGGADGDVNGFGTGVRPFGTYDRATGVKQCLFAEGVNHNFFNTSWVCDDAHQQFFLSGACVNLDPTGLGANLVTATNCRDLARCYVTAFARKHGQAQAGYDDYFKRYPQRFRPPSLANSIPLFHQYRSASADRLDVDDFQTRGNVGISSSNGPVTTVGSLKIEPFDGVNEPKLLDPNPGNDFAGAILTAKTGAAVAGLTPARLDWFAGLQFERKLAGRTGNALFILRHEPVAQRAVPETWTATLNAAGRWDLNGSVSGADITGAKVGGKWDYETANGRLRLIIRDGAGAGAFVAGDSLTSTYLGVNPTSRGVVNRFMQDTDGVVVSWGTMRCFYKFGFPEPAPGQPREVDLRPYRYASLRIANTVPDPAAQRPTVHFTLRGSTGDGGVASVPLQPFTTVPGPYVSGFRTGLHESGTELRRFNLDQWTTCAVFQTVRLDLCRFTLQTAMDLGRFKELSIDFGASAGSNNGIVALDEIEFTKE